MPATRTVHNPYATGQGFTSVPVLFSLPNVQPAIAAASSGVASETTTGRQTMREPRPDIAVTESTVAANNTSFDSAPIMVSSTGSTSNRTDAWLSKLTSQMTNITIVVLLVAVAGLAYQNQQHSQGKKSSPESETLAQVAPVAPTSTQAPATTLAAPENSDPAPSQLEMHHSELGTNESPSIALPAPQKETLVVEKGAIPLLLPPAPQESVNKGDDTATNGSLPTITNGPAANPFSLTSSKVGMTQGSAATATNNTAQGQADRARWEAIETETPSLNTRDIILLRNGQRRPESGTSDPGLPKVESVMRPQSGSRVISSSNGGTPVMTGQSYPPIAPQYEPISMPKPSPLRITQPSTDASQKPAQKQYIPLGAVLPNSN